MNIALVGYGNTGCEVERAALAHNHSIAARWTSRSPIPDDLSSFRSSQPIDCCIDFSSPADLTGRLAILLKHHIPVVIGTTGWNNQIDDVRALVAAHQGSVIYASNFSIGAHLLFRLAAAAGTLLNSFPEYDAAVHEVHHRMKKDAPSGTALTLGKILLTALDRKTSIRSSAEGGAPRPEQLWISSSRIGDVRGTHTLHFHSSADEIELIHRVRDRSCFARGALWAAEWIQGRAGFHAFDDVVFNG